MNWSPPAVGANPNTEEDLVVFQELDPFLADELPVRGQETNLLHAEGLEKTSYEHDALLCAEIPGLAQRHPEQEDGSPLVSDCQEKDVDLDEPQPPVGPVQTHDPALLDRQDCGDESGDDRGIDRKLPEKSLNALVMGIDLRCPGKFPGDPAQIERLSGDDGQEESGKKVDSGLIPVKMFVKLGFEYVEFDHGLSHIMEGV